MSEKEILEAEIKSILKKLASTHHNIFVFVLISSGFTLLFLILFLSESRSSSTNVDQVTPFYKYVICQNLKAYFSDGNQKCICVKFVKKLDFLICKGRFRTKIFIKKIFTFSLYSFREFFCCWGGE